MKKLQFSLNIHASKERIWSILWNDDTYRKWTSVFSEGSYAVGDWNEGNKMLFLTPAGEGMFSKIVRNIPNDFLAIQHLGVVKNHVEQPLDEETKKWTGAIESYTLLADGEFTLLTVELDASEEHEPYFRDMFPKALQKVKELSEK